MELVKDVTIKNQELYSEYCRLPQRKYSALNFMVFATELKLLIFKISVRTF